MGSAPRVWHELRGLDLKAYDLKSQFVTSPKLAIDIDFYDLKKGVSSDK